jgi:hypothetical protein
MDVLAIDMLTHVVTEVRAEFVRGKRAGTQNEAMQHTPDVRRSETLNRFSTKAAARLSQCASPASLARPRAVRR